MRETWRSSQIASKRRSLVRLQQWSRQLWPSMTRRWRCRSWTGTSISGHHKTCYLEANTRIAVTFSSAERRWPSASTKYCLVAEARAVFYPASQHLGESWKLRGHMASAKREPIIGVWGQRPQRSPGAEPLVGVRGRSPPPAEAESIVACGRPVETAKLPHSLFLQTQYT